MKEKTNELMNEANKQNAERPRFKQAAKKKVKRRKRERKIIKKKKLI